MRGKRQTRRVSTTLGCWQIKFDENDAKLAKLARITLDEYRERLGEPIIGRTRVVFVDEEQGLVFKVATCREGLEANYKEAAWESDEYPIASCRLIPGSEKSWPVLEMEMVKPAIGERSTLPAWTGWFDSAQVGYTKQGQLVLYDL